MSKDAGTQRQSRSVTEIIWGAVLLIAGLVMRFVLSAVDVPMVDLARTGEVVACIGAIMIVYGGYLAIRR